MGGRRGGRRGGGKNIYIYIYIIYTPNLGFGIALFDQEREQGRFRGSNEGARGRSKGAPREHRGVSSEHGGAGTGAQHREPELEFSYPALPAYIHFIVDTVGFSLLLPGFNLTRSLPSIS